jgi:orotidine-5'-phosphate decarboxylase
VALGLSLAAPQAAGVAAAEAPDSDTGPVSAGAATSDGVDGSESPSHGPAKSHSDRTADGAGGRGAGQRDRTAARVLRADLGPTFKLVTPGVRPIWSAANDQKRFMSPADALKAGADYLVIGRPITAAADPAAAATRIAAEIAPFMTAAGAAPAAPGALS